MISQESGFPNLRHYLCLLFLSLAVTYTHGIGFTGLYGQDAYSYLAFSKEIKQFFNSHAPVSAFYWPALYPMAGALLSYFFSPVLSLQLISILCFTLTFYFLSRIAELLYGHSIFLQMILAVSWFTSPYMFRLGLSSMSDMQSILFAVLFLFLLLRFEKNRNQFLLLWAALSATSAVFTHYPTAILLLPLTGLFIFRNLKRIKPGFALMAAGCSATLALLALSFNFDSLLHTTGHHLANSWSVLNFFSTTFVTVGEGVHQYTLPNLVFVLSLFFNPGFSILCIVALTYSILKKLKMQVEMYSLFCVTGGLIFFAGLAEQNIRHISVLYPFTLILFIPIIGVSVDKLKQKFVCFFTAAILLFNLILIPRAIKPFNDLCHTDQQLAMHIKKISAGKLVYGMGLSELFKAYDIDNNVFEIFSKKITSVDTNAVAVFDENALQTQWKNKLPYQNFLLVKKVLGIKKPEAISGNYSIYKLGK